MEKSVVISCFPAGAERARQGYAIVAIDVIRATTTAITAVTLGRECHTVSSVEAAKELASTLDNPLLVGELGGDKPEGFDITNSPAEIAMRFDISRPMVLLSSSGTQLLDRVKIGSAVYLACLRNYRALVKHLSLLHTKVAIIGAGTRGEFREEDQMCCAWIAEGLVKAGFHCEDQQTNELIDRWQGAAADAFLESKSVAYLRRSDQLRDLDFILNHIGDLDAVFQLSGTEVIISKSYLQAVA